MTSISFVDFLILFLQSKMEKEIDMIPTLSDRCAAQFRSRYAFCLFTEIQKDINFGWHYFEVNCGKGVMDGIQGTIKNMVFKKVLSGSTVTNTPKELAEFANKVSIISSSYLPHSNYLLQEPDQVGVCRCHKGAQDCTELHFKGCAL